MKQSRICLVGCGTIGAMHAKNFSDDAALYFYSRSRESAEGFQTKFRGAGVFDDFQAVLESDVDALVIASPPEFHTRQMIAAVQAGKAVLVERPLCTSPDEVVEIERALAAADRPLLMVAENYYYKPSLTFIKQLIADGAVGQIQSVAVQKLTMQQAAGWKSGYGALLEGGIHFVALISDLFDASPASVAATFPNQSSGLSERHAVVELAYEDGATAELRYSWSTPSLTRGVFQHSRIVGDRGHITFESNGIYVCSRWTPRFPGLRDLMGYGAMTQDFLDCVADRTRVPYSNFPRAKRDLQIVFDAYEHLP